MPDNCRGAVSISLDVVDHRNDLLEGFFFELNEFLSERHGYKKHKCRRWCDKVDANCAKFSLTLSVSHDNAIRISAIQFAQRRRGHCSALLDFIDRVSGTYAIPYVEFVSVSSEAMKKFVQKYNFRNRDGWFSYLEDGYTSSFDWFRPTKFGNVEEY